MRALPFTVAALLIAAAPAQARVAVTTELRSSVGPLESFQYFAPELERALAAAAARAGLDDGALAASLEELPGGSARLTLTWKGRSAQGEGRLGRLDQLVTEITGKLRASVDEPVAKATRPEKKDAPVAVAKKTGDLKPDARPADRPEPKETPKVEAKLDPPRPDLKAEPPKVEAKLDPPRPDLATASTLQYPYGERRRIVAHALADLSSSTYPTTGALSTQALYFFLARRLRLQVVPTGFGIVPPATITDEIYRSQAGAGVMAELLEISVRPIENAPPEVKVKLELVIVREGRVLLRKQLESGPVVGTMVRGRPVDPLYLAVLSALDGARDELQGAF